MLDSDGYRPNVGIILCNDRGEVLWARRCGRDGWQFPQGGINRGESPEQALYRELREEVGLAPDAVDALGIVRCRHRTFYQRQIVRPFGYGPGGLRETGYLYSICQEQQFILTIEDTQLARC